MNRKPLVSTVMIFFNEEKFLPEAIESVFAQTYDDWELLLVDDGSSDASTKIARRCAEQNPGKVYYLEHEGHQNRGMSASRNLGIRPAKGDYIAFLDADDVWLPEKLEQQVAILSSHPEAGMVCGPVQWWYSWTGNPEDIQRDYVVTLHVQLDTVIEPPHLLTYLLGNETATTTGGLVRREAIEGVGGFEESFHGLYEDQAFCAKLCSKVPVFVASTCWYTWRKHPGSCCAVAVRTGQYDRARLTFLHWLERHLSDQRVSNREVSRVLRREIWHSRHPVLNRLLAKMKETPRIIAYRALPPPVRRWLKAQLNPISGRANG
jgi:glycosyltransferase involved in cell wall biosynthesis